jgi:hypothetical protein
MPSAIGVGLPAVNAPQYNANLAALAILRQQLHNDAQWYGQMAVEQVIEMHNMTTPAINQVSRDLAKMRLGMRVAMHDISVAAAQQMVATANYNAYTNATDHVMKQMFAKRCNAAIDAEKAAIIAAQHDIYAEDNWGSAAQSLLEVYVD